MSKDTNERSRLKILIKKIKRYIKDGRFKKLKKLYKLFNENGDTDLFVKEINKKHGSKERTFLLKYCSKGDSIRVKLLIRFDADVKITDVNGNTALHAALNYVLDNFDWNFFHDDITSMILQSHETILKLKNKYGETPEALLEEVLSMLNKKQSSYLIETSDSSDNEVDDKSWNEKLFFEMGNDDNFQNENYAQDEFVDTFKRVNKETYDEWGDRMRTEYMHKKYPKPAKVEPPLVNDKRQKDNNPKKIIGPTITTELFKKLRIINEREVYEKRCSEIFNSKSHSNNLSFNDIPWPIEVDLLKENSPSSLMDDVIEFLTFGFVEEDQVKYMKQQQIRWHPDRFKMKCGNKIIENEKEKIYDFVKNISQKINSFLETFK